MSDRFRALCAEMLDKLSSLYRDIVDSGVGYVDDEGRDLMDRSRAALAEPVAEPPAVAEEEVAELVAWLKENAEDERQMSRGDNPASLKLDRAAELLERAMPVPVSVVERMPGPEDCDPEGQCWTTDYDPSLVYSPVWKMTELPRQELGQDFSNAYFWRNVTYWLPADALPLPTPNLTTEYQ